MEGLDRIIREHPFFAGLEPPWLDLICGCCRNVRFDADQYLLREGEPADTIFLLRHGRVALEMTVPGRGALTFLTLGEGDLVGVSWLLPPYRWAYDARALELVRAIAIDAACLRRKCDEDRHFGYEMMKRVLPVLLKRLQAARLQMLDVYGRPD